MCRRRFGWVLIPLVLGLPGLATGQQAERWRDSALQLATRIRALRDSMLQGDSTVSEVARRGDLVIGASEELRGSAGSALERFTRARERWFGGASPSPAGFRILLRSSASQYRGGLFLPENVQTLVLAGLPDSGGAVRTQRNVYRRQFPESLIDLYGEMMYASAGPALLKWLELVPPLSMADKERRYIAMYALVTGTGRAQRGCVAGNLEDCAYALTLRAPTRTEPGGAYAPIVRTDLLLTALELGGAEAWTRFRGTADRPIEAALADAAGMPADSLIARWRSGLLALRPTEAPVSLQGVLLAGVWAAALLLGALGVSRWA